MKIENMSAEVKAAIESFKARFNSLELVYVDRYINEDEDGYATGLITAKPQEITIEKMVENWTDEWFVRGFYFIGEEQSEQKNNQYLTNWFNDIKTFKDLACYWNDVTDGSSYLFIKQEYEEKISEETRKTLEGSAASFSAKHKTGGVNILFLTILQEEIDNIESSRESFNEPEAKMERMGRCGSNREAFWDDQEYENNKYDAKVDALVNIQQYVKDNLPLLWARYQEIRYGKHLQTDI